MTFSEEKSAAVAGVSSAFEQSYLFLLYEKTLYLELKNSIEVSNNTVKGAY